jgi:hypothetical protein
MVSGQRRGTRLRDNALLRAVGESAIRKAPGQRSVQLDEVHGRDRKRVFEQRARLERHIEIMLRLQGLALTDGRVARKPIVEAKVQHSFCGTLYEEIVIRGKDGNLLRKQLCFSFIQDSRQGRQKLPILRQCGLVRLVA